MSKDSTLNNVLGVSHFIMDGDITPNQKNTKQHSDWKSGPVKSKYEDIFLPDIPQTPDTYIAQHKKQLNGEYLVRYKKFKDIKGIDLNNKKYLDEEGYDSKLPVRSNSFANIDWNNKGKSTGWQIGQKSNYIPTKKGQETSISSTGNQNFSRFSGGSVTYLFTDKNGKQIGIDVSGIPEVLKEQGEQIIKDYELNPKDLHFTYQDMGRYSAKPKANSKNQLSTAQWKDYNTYAKGFSGAAFVIPAYSKGGKLFSLYKFKLDNND
jgi:hypothetical protein